MKKDFLSLRNFSKQELLEILALAKNLKKEPNQNLLLNKAISNDF